MTRTKKEILQEMVEEMSFEIPQGSLRYIEEAMDIYADQFKPDVESREIVNPNKIVVELNHDKQGNLIL